MIDSGKVSYERRGQAAVMMITRPGQHNAIDVETAEALRRGYRVFEADDTARVLVLTAKGEGAFCAGADLDDLAGLSARLHKPGGTIGLRRFTASKPTIAAISGWCLGTGVHLAVWCALRIAAAGSTFGGIVLGDSHEQRASGIPGVSPRPVHGHVKQRPGGDLVGPGPTAGIKSGRRIEIETRE